MSDKFSSASGTISTELTERDFMKCTSLNLTMILYICCIIIICSLLVLCVNSISMSALKVDDNITYEDPFYTKGMMCDNDKCECNKYKYQEDNEYQEDFGNDDELLEIRNYIRIPLLAPFDEFKNPTNLFFGQVNRYTLADSYRLEIFCNLLVLDGNMFDVAKRGTINQKYTVYLVNDKTNKKLLLGPLYKDGDGIYKMKINFKENIKELLSYNKIIIVYSLDNQEQILLEGFFK